MINPLQLTDGLCIPSSSDTDSNKKNMIWTVQTDCSAKQWAALTGMTAKVEVNETVTIITP